MEVTPVGYVRSMVKEAVDAGWGEVVCTIELEPGLAGGLQGLEAFSHAVIVYFMHEARFDPSIHLQRHPREREDLPLVGIFAQRARHRPNRIGMTTVKILKVEENLLIVKGLDAIDGTPVLDIKPYVPAFDKTSDADIPVWMEELMKDYF